MLVAYRNRSLERCFSDYRILRKKLPLPWVKTIVKELNWLESANTLEDLLRLGLGHPEALSGSMDGLWSLRISGNARLILRPVGNEQALLCTEIRIEGVVDYHGERQSWYLP